MKRYALAALNWLLILTGIVWCWPYFLFQFLADKSKEVRAIRRGDRSLFSRG